MSKYHVYFKDSNNQTHLTCVYASNIYRARFVAYDTHPIIHNNPYCITLIEEIN